jgi:DNA-binding transcriptional ArsR family regulator
MAKKVKDKNRSRDMVGARLVKTLANPWRARILDEVYLRPMSPSQFVEEVGGEISTISRHFRWLADAGYIEVADEKSGGRRRGGVEHIFRTIRRNRFDTSEWADLPPATREMLSQNALGAFFRRVVEALDAGTFDAEVDRHISWDALSLDRQGWTEISDRLDEVLDWFSVVEAQAAQRMSESGEEAIPATVGLAAFRSPTKSGKTVLRAKKKSG